MIDVLIEAPLAPIAKGRPRTRVVQSGRGGAFATTYTPRTTRDWEASLAALAATQLPAEILEGPLRVDVLAVLPRPQSLLRAKDPPLLVWHEKRPDADNIRKAVLDALKGFWRDDSQVVSGETLKVYAERAGRPRTVVRIQAERKDPTTRAVTLGLMRHGYEEAD